MIKRARTYITLIVGIILGVNTQATIPVDSSGIKFSIDTANVRLDQVVVTAREGNKATSTSLIDTTAMQHLQPSSFSDILQLLPGGVTKDPVMGQVNTIALRQASGMSNTDEDYMTQALGTSFVIDGVPINTSAGMQTTPDINHSGHSAVGRGVDMRSISTDDIAEIEIVRGIASVEYGEITSGIINIKRKSGISRLEARFKADTKSQLFYVGKGFAMPGDKWTMNVSAGYLDARIDPRNSRENYKRVDGSLRSDKRWASTMWNVEWNSSLSYSATYETDNNDPDLTVNNTIDRFSTRNHAFRWNNTVKARPVKNGVLTDLSLTTGISYTRERLTQERHVAPSRVMPMAVSMRPGSNYVGYLPMLYLAHLDVAGDPFSAYLKAATAFRFNLGNVTSMFKTGIEWNMSKNYGRGQIYDIERPITFTNVSRPRAFSDIPAMHQLSAYIESRNLINLGGHTLEAVIGIRETQLLHLHSRYKLSGKPYVDPRATLTWVLPRMEIAGEMLSPTISIGTGYQTKMPVAAFLYPDLRYTDFEQLNYYHNEPNFRVMNVMTYIEDLTNFNLEAARNFKREIRIDLAYRGNRLSVTCFRETMNDGFRHTGNVHRYTYNRYDASGYDPYATGSAPVIDKLPFTTVVYQAVRNTVTNGSRTMKEGVEYTFQSRRFSTVKTRVTVNGAYFHTVNNNSQPLWYKPSIIVNGKELQYVGLYDDTDGSEYKSLNTNVMLDTDISKLGLRFSIGVQSVWFTSRRTLFRQGRPVMYMNPDGEIFPYTDESASDPYLGQLVRNYSSSSFDTHTVPPEFSFNLKATKTFWDSRVGVALYVNRLFYIAPSYKEYGVTVRRYSSPYFGMELNFKI